jgi:hypothetical protein
MPTVRLVTAAHKTTASIAAFEDELKNLGWGNNTTQPYSAVDYGDLPSAAQKAKDDASANDVFVADGLNAALLLVAKAPDTMPIVLALGGSQPQEPPDNLTGFYIDATGVAIEQAKALLKIDPKIAVTILYDSSNDASGPAYDAVKHMFATKPTELDIGTAADLKNLKAKGITTAGFMVIPNAIYYENIKEVTKLADGNDKVTAVYYPEREYKNAHVNKTGVSVIGHGVLITFRVAAHYVNNILTGYWSVDQGNLPELQEAVPDAF